MNYLQNQHVLVLGLGDSGLAMATWCAKWGAQVTVWDSRELPPQAQALAQAVPGAVRLSGGLGDQALLGVQLVLKSPGLSPSDARIAPTLALARQSGVRVQGELDLFATALAELKTQRGYAPKVIAITGTNGKTTTTAMTAQLIERTGLRVAVAGNIGPCMLDVLGSALDLEPVVDVVLDVGDVPELKSDVEQAEPAALAENDLATHDGGGPPPHLVPPPPPGPVFAHLPEVWVLELSSFQLDGVTGFEPSAAAVLNISQDHLDWHGDMAAYTQAKAQVFGSHAVIVINQDDPAVVAMVPKAVPGKAKFAKPVERHVVRFSLSAPKYPGDFGLLIENDIAWLAHAPVADDVGVRRKRGAVPQDEFFLVGRLMPADALRVRGRHNAANALAALALATAVGCPLAPMLHGLRDYAGEPHRVQFVAIVAGVQAFDDSKGTNVGATVAALNGLGADQRPSKLVVILGGDGKGQDFTPLCLPVQQMARAVATLGQDAGAIEAALQDCGVPLQRHHTLQDATRWAFAQALQGDAVLLSPACASLDMFQNYAHRGEVFVAEVQALAQDAGVSA